MITIQINKTKYDIPTKWEEVTVQQYIDIMLNVNELSPVKLLSILTRIDFDILNNFTCDAFSIEAMPLMDWLGEPFNPRNSLRPMSITINGKKIKTIQDAGQERFGQKLFMQQMVTKAIENNAPHVSLIAPVLACYYAPYLHQENKWIESHVKEVEQMIMKLPIVVAYPEADFFLSGYIKYKPKKIMS